MKRMSTRFSTLLFIPSVSTPRAGTLVFCEISCTAVTHAVMTFWSKTIKTVYLVMGDFEKSSGFCLSPRLI